MEDAGSPFVPKIQWRRAWTALGKLIEDPQRTDQVFEITQALAGRSFERSYQRFVRSPEGRRLLDEKPNLLRALSDRETLRRLPPGSFGRAYVEFMESGNLTPDGLVEADEMVARRHAEEQPPPGADRQYYGERIRDMHDLWHVLTGYGMDEAGEAANLAFTLAQVPTGGVALIVLAAVVIGPKDLRLTWQRYLYRAWRRGRRARPLPLVPYEELLDQPLSEVRRRLDIEPPEVAHPQGVVVAQRNAVLG
jgi:ubiquinone biosynthesis protein COQ4